MTTYDECLRELVTANRILAHVGGGGCVRPCQRAASGQSGTIFAVAFAGAGIDRRRGLDGIHPRRGRHRSAGPPPYGERVIHGAVYEARPEVNAVVHNHSYELIPFGITDTPLRAVAHTCASIGAEIPVWDIRDKFGETDHLVITMEQGRDLATCLGDRGSEVKILSP